MWVFWWWFGGISGLRFLAVVVLKEATWVGGCWLFKKAESEDDWARESYSSSAPLEDCKLPLVLAESMRAENGKT